MKGLTKQLWFIILLRSKTYCSTVCVCFPQQQLYQCTYVQVHVHSYVLQERTKRVNEEILLGKKPIFMHNCKFISSCTIIYVCTYDLHFNVLCGLYASELKGLTKKLPFSILPRNKDFHAKLLPWFLSVTSSQPAPAL